MNEISWTALAEEMYLEHLKFLLEYFPSDIAIKFDKKVEDILARLVSFSELCPASKVLPHFRKCLIDRHYSLVYRIDNQVIQIVAIIDNRSRHGF
jgi:plasmid stabilization system protein ParE